MIVDAAGFAELYKTVYRDLYRFALCMLRHSQDAEDAVSEAVLAAYENIHKLRKEEAFRAWIFTILANVCRKKLKGKERTEQELLPHHAKEEPCDGLRIDVQKAFFILDGEEQTIVALSVFGGYTSREIGEMLKMNANTVRSRRSRALEKMSVVLKEE
ncbi:sigma-70 family RNA polymerase sigma factor [Candidatus Bariatricus faecipullorum]